MRRQVMSCALGLALFSPLQVEASPVYTFAEVTALTNANAGGMLWNANQSREIMTPTAGEAETAMVTRDVTGANGSGTGNVASQVSLGVQGLTGSLTQAMNLTANSNFAFNFVAGGTSGAAFAGFTLSMPHTYLATASGQIAGPSAPDDQLLGVEIQLIRGSSNYIVAYDLLAAGPVSLNQSGVLPAGTYTYSAVMVNVFAYDATPPGAYGSSGNMSFAITLNPVPESSSIVLIAAAAAGWRALFLRRLRR